jgi:hypothetical protein
MAYQTFLPVAQLLKVLQFQLLAIFNLTNRQSGGLWFCRSAKRIGNKKAGFMSEEACQ